MAGGSGHWDDVYSGQGADGAGAWAEVGTYLGVLDGDAFPGDETWF